MKVSNGSPHFTASASLIEQDTQCIKKGWSFGSVQILYRFSQGSSLL